MYNMSNVLKTDLLLTAADMEPGDRMRIICPQCGGGTTHETCMSLARNEDGSVMWNCFRNACQFSGRSSGGRLVRTRSEPRTQKFTPYTGRCEALSDDDWEVLASKFGLLLDRYNPSISVVLKEANAGTRPRIMFPIYSPMGARRGWVRRDVTNTKAQKALTNMDSAEPHMSWYRAHPGGTVLVVEDIPSALRASLYINAVALNGTGCGPDYVNEIAAHATRVVWALDADAIAQAVKLHRANQMLFTSSMVLPLEKDLKDMSEARLKELLDGVAK